MSKTKTFDALEFKERAGRHIYELLRGMSVEEQVAFWKQETEELRREIEARKRTGSKS